MALWKIDSPPATSRSMPFSQHTIETAASPMRVWDVLTLTRYMRQWDDVPAAFTGDRIARGVRRVRRRRGCGHQVSRRIRDFARRAISTIAVDERGAVAVGGALAARAHVMWRKHASSKEDTKIDIRFGEFPYEMMMLRQHIHLVRLHYANIVESERKRIWSDPELVNHGEERAAHDVACHLQDALESGVTTRHSTAAAVLGTDPKEFEALHEQRRGLKRRNFVTRRSTKVL